MPITPPLQNAKEVLNIVAVVSVAARKTHGLSVRAGYQHSSDDLVVHIGNVKGAGTALALHKRDDLLFGRDFAGQLLLFEPTDNRFVALDHLAGSAKWFRIDRGHGFPNTVRHKPCRLIRDAKVPLQLVRADALLTAIE